MIFNIILCYVNFNQHTIQVKVTVFLWKKSGKLSQDLVDFNINNNFSTYDRNFLLKNLLHILLELYNEKNFWYNINYKSWSLLSWKCYSIAPIYFIRKSIFLSQNKSIKCFTHREFSLKSHRRPSRKNFHFISQFFTLLECRNCKRE